MDALPLNLVRPEVPVELAALVAKMMAKEPERRFQTPGRGGPGADAVLQAGREPGVRTEPRDLPRRAGSLVSPACRRWVRTGATGDARHGPSPRATGSVEAEPGGGGVGEPDRAQGDRALGEQGTGSRANATAAVEEVADRPGSAPCSD